MLEIVTKWVSKHKEMAPAYKESTARMLAEAMTFYNDPLKFSFFEFKFVIR